MTWRRGSKGYLHKSMLNMWRTCPYMYRSLFIDRVSCEIPRVMQLGRNFHSFAKEFFNVLDIGTLTSMNTLSDVRNYMRSIVYVNDPELREYCECFANFEAQRYWDIVIKGMDVSRYYKPLRTEFFFEDDELERAGTVDRVDLLPDNTLVVVDYKPTIYKWAISKLRQELVFYAEPVNNLNLCPPYKVRWIGCYAYRTGQCMVEQIKHQTLSALSKNIAKMKADTRFPRKPSDYCADCLVNFLCVDSPELEEWRIEHNND